MFKTCSKCKIEKDTSMFYQSRNRKGGYHCECKNCDKTYRLDNKTRISKYLKQYYINNKEQLKLHRFNNRLKRNQYNKQYKINNKDKIKLYNREYRLSHKDDIKNNSNGKLKHNIRSRILTALKDDVKSQSTLGLLGCSLEQFRQYLQQTALKNGYKDFDINNYSGKEYNIHHIVHCENFNLACSYHQKLCFNWSNQEILSVEDHRRIHS